MGDWNRLTHRDMQRAYAIASEFFLDEIHCEVLFDDPTNITQQNVRAAEPPAMRSAQSNAAHPQHFWKNWATNG